MLRAAWRWLCLSAWVIWSCAAAPCAAGSRDGRLDLYFIDVEGGAATLIVTPTGESILIDSGYPDNAGRDLNRILHVIRDVAGLDHLDHAAVTHWHRDHYGNHAALAAQLPIRRFWDRGIPDSLAEDPEFPARIAQYRAATQNQSTPLKAGSEFELPGGAVPLKIRIVAASREVIPNIGPPNPFADRHRPQDPDPSDNSASVSLLLAFGDFRFLCCGDLTWNMEARLVTPNNPLGQVDLFMVTHHGLPSSNNPALVLAIDPVVAVMCNGPTKGGHPQTLATLREVRSLQALYQLHRNIELPAEAQTPAEFIANSEPTVNCSGVWVLASVAGDGRSYTVQIGPEGRRREYRCRGAAAAAE
jgi:beta-lactamase superfamily II metal-dependent hydrolase